MPAWLTAAEATARWGTSRIAMATGGDDALVTAAIAAAESRVRSELIALRYTPADLPTTPETSSDTLKRIVGGFFWHYLHESKDVRGDDVRDAYSDARAELKAVATGNLSLNLAGDPPVDHARADIHVGQAVGGGNSRPTLDDCWEGYD